MADVQATHVLQKTGKDGILRVELPLGSPETEFDVLVLTRPHAGREPIRDSEWPPGFFEEVFGSIPDIERPPQGEREKRLDFE